MSLTATTATAQRVLNQLRRDPRTLGLLLFMPAILVTLIKFVFDGDRETFDKIGAPLIGLFPFITMFLVTSITMLRERTGGTLERLMSMPLGKLRSRTLKFPLAGSPPNVNGPYAEPK